MLLTETIIDFNAPVNSILSVMLIMRNLYQNMLCFAIICQKYANRIYVALDVAYVDDDESYVELVVHSKEC